jgi:DMSO/TMAO reductase YedYZ molybdopterin-dependent catalytic subunit
VAVSSLYYYYRTRNDQTNKKKELKGGLDTDLITETEKANLERRLRIAEQTKKSFENKAKQELEVSKESGKLLPPGQRMVKKWIVLDLGLKPPEEFKNLENWKLKMVDSKTGKEMFITLEEIKALGVHQFTSDFHCYTGWTIQNLKFTGVPLKRIIDKFSPSSSWQYLYQVGADGYTTNGPRSEFEKEEVYLAWEWDGKPIPVEHGVIRLITPILYGSKSSKYLSELYFMEEDEKGFWELRGVHERGNVMLEERYSQKKREKTGMEEAEKIIKKCKEEFSTELDLSGLELDEIPLSVFELTSLRTLLLYNNNLSSIPENIKSLSKLKSISLNSNKFSQIPPAVICQLTSLTELWICDNQLKTIPIELKNLQKLFVFGFERNQISELPPWIVEFPNLNALFGDLNQIKSIPRELAARHWGALCFSSNPIEFIPKEISNLKDITFLGFFGCKCIPSEVLQEGTPSILKYLESGDADLIEK